jgi:hypothetical protein
MVGFAAGFRIGPEPSAVTVLGRSQKQDIEDSSPPRWTTINFSTVFVGRANLWISAADILGSDGVAPRKYGYDRGLVADHMTSDSPPRFAHQSEAELARILDYYGVAWRYEPDVFPISWNADGAVIESFAPDFFLPEIGLYIELTTLKQSLVRKKNRKLRYLRQLYPEIRVKLFYARDFRALMLKYGRLDFLTDVTAANGAYAHTGAGNGSTAAVQG